jgi:protein-S-isoprenylcysteine O-methyltransferase Ste14
MPAITSDRATFALTGSLLLAASITYRCWSPPNPNPSGPTASLPKDGMGIGPGAIQIRRSIVLFLWIWHILLTAFYPSPPVVLCPNPENLSSLLFTWTPSTIAVLVTILVAGPIRLFAFRQLGENFTFRLAKPTALVKTGLYSCVQHPSYPTHWLILSSNFALLLRPEGVLGCMVPSQVVRWSIWSVAVSVWPALLVVLSVGGLFGIWIRVKDEEAMLQKAFGSEWEEYHQKTARFIPGIF